MDTDDLSEETYLAIIVEAGNFHSDLSLHFGLLCCESKDEQEFLAKSTHWVNELKMANSGGLEDYFIGNVPNLEHFFQRLSQILDNIEKVNRIPITNRTFE